MGTMQTTVTAGLSTQGAMRTSGTILGTTEVMLMGAMIEVGNPSSIWHTGTLDQGST
jgi:hypothetical protein